jgi:hypothetical protein
MTYEPDVQVLCADVAALATPAGRMVGSAGHERARDFLCKRMSSLGLEPYNGAAGYGLPYQHGGQDFFNLVGVLPGADRQARPVLLGAHYDSVIDAPCADDNAAAVAITLAVAKRLRAECPARDVLVAFFDAEEPPYFLSQAMGSIRFVLDQMDPRGVGCALIQDLTGHDVSLPVPAAGSVALPRIKDLVFMTGAESHPRLADLVRGCLDRSNLPVVAALNEHVGDMSDHHAFREMGLPYLFFSCGRWKHYHQRSDTPEKLNYEKMARIAALLADVALACAACDLPKIAGDTDTAAFEINLLERAFGALLPALLRLVGVSKLHGRADLDTLAAALTGLGL